MSKLFNISFTHRVIAILVLLMNIPLFLTLYISHNVTERMVLEEKEEKLLALARTLDVRLGPGGFDAILERFDAQNADRERKIAILNRELTDITEEVAASALSLGIGYYSKEVDSIVTYGPRSEFAYAVGMAVPLDHPGRVVMRTGQGLVRSGSMVRGDIMNAMIPIKRYGKIIGYTWANELTDDVEAQFSDMARKTLIVALICFGLTLLVLLLLARRTVRDIDRIIRGVRQMRSDLSTRLGGCSGELGELAASINFMAEDIGKANEESGRAMTVLQSVMDNMEAVIYVCDPQTKEIVYSNKYVQRLLNREVQPGDICYRALHEKTSPCYGCPQVRLLGSDGGAAVEALRWEGRNKLVQRDFLVTDRLITWHDGRLLHMEVATDVTERNALAVAEAANQARRDFLARMSHEIRTPMNGVLGMTHLAIQADPPPAQLEYLRKIQSSASILLGIINDILDFSRIEAGKIEIERTAFNLRELIENIRELILPRIQEKRLELRIDIGPDVPEYAVGDGLRLSQVLLNLLSNAAKFTQAGSVSLRLDAELTPPDRLRLSCRVRDTGIGMSAEQRRVLFKPFSQADVSTSREFGGTGLGLSISKALVELMDGTIDVSSETGKGSEFFFHVDMEPAGCIADERPEQALWENARYDGRCFLLVEDNIINQEIATAILEELGAAVDVADNGQLGLEAFMNKDYAVILMDVRMPVMDGLEATRRIRASGKRDARSVPVIAMTANAMHEDRASSREAGMDGHIAKPIDVDALKRLLWELLGPEKE